MTQRISMLLFLVAMGVTTILVILVKIDTPNKNNGNNDINNGPSDVYAKIQNIKMSILSKVQQEVINVPEDRNTVTNKNIIDSPLNVDAKLQNIGNSILSKDQPETFKAPKPSDALLSNKNISQDDPELIELIKDKFLKPPTSKSYALKDVKNNDPSMGQSKEIRKILGEKQGGFFIECGALDGETRSNTLVFEKQYGWSGLLIEGDPKNFELVKKKNRKSWSINTCLSSKPYPDTVLFEQKFNVGKISKLSPKTERKGYTKVQCLPLFSILLALNTTTVDYFSLDVEGLELEVLQTIPWDRVNIRTLSVEFQHGKGGKYSLVNYMLQKGYYVYSDVTHPGRLANDFIFYKNDIVPNKAP